MSRSQTASILCVTAICCCLVTPRGDAAADDAGLRTALVGTWKMKSMKVNGTARDLPETAVTYKHVTPAGFTWLSYEKDTGKVFRVAGGTYTLNGDEYAEKIEYGNGRDFDLVKNAAHAFKCRIDADTWHHTGRLASGTTIDEEWTRVRPPDAPRRP